MRLRWVVMLCVLAGAGSLGAADGGTREGTESLRGLKGVYAQDLRLADSLAVDVDSILTQEGVGVVPFVASGGLSPELLAHTVEHVYRCGEGYTGGYEVTLRLVQLVSLARDPSIRVRVATWSMSTGIIRTQTATPTVAEWSVIAAEAVGLVRRFAQDYRAANPGARP